MNLHHHPYVASQLADHRLAELRRDADRVRGETTTRAPRSTRQRRGWRVVGHAVGQE